MEDIRLYQIALKKLNGVGGLRARKLVSYCGGLVEFFEATNKKLLTVPGLGQGFLRRLNRTEALKSAEKELKFVDQRNLTILFYLNDDFPHRLKHCEDAPVLLYAEGQMNLNPAHVVSIVGTRDCTDYGVRITERLIEGLKLYNPLVVSGLAYGIDTIAHRSAVQMGMQTVGVLGHSLDRIYPDTNAALTRKMRLNGGLLSEFESGTKPDRENFPQRNRIVAGMADVTIVVETGVKGGSMITARLASSYNRDVAAFPGAVDQPFSAGCNHLIKTNQATLIESVDDLIYLMGWEQSQGASTPQKQLFVDLNEEEKTIVQTLSARQKASLDNLSLECGWPISKTSSMLLELEFKGMVRSLPGKIYALA